METISHVKIKNFGVFDELELEPTPGINVLVGRNGTGKTHLMKLLYSLTSYSHTGLRLSVEEKLLAVFAPNERRLGRLVRRKRGKTSASVSLRHGNRRLHVSWDTLSEAKASVRGRIVRLKPQPHSVIFIPAQEFLSHAEGFEALYKKREIAFDETYYDLLLHADTPPARGVVEVDRKKLLDILKTRMGGTVVRKDGVFHLKTPGEGIIEFPLVAEGLRKLGLLWLLIQNRTLIKGSILFWDEPEANLNPSLQKIVAEVLIVLQRMGVQVFVATHDYFFLKELDLLSKKRDSLMFHVFARDSEMTPAKHNVFKNYSAIKPNDIDAALEDLYERNIAKVLVGKK